jgi:hypothetical protein
MKQFKKGTTQYFRNWATCNLGINCTGMQDSKGEGCQSEQAVMWCGARKGVGEKALVIYC